LPGAHARRGATRSAKRRIDVSTRSFGIVPPGFIHNDSVVKPSCSRSASSWSDGFRRTEHRVVGEHLVVGDLGQIGGCGFWYGLGMMQTSWN